MPHFSSYAGPVVQVAAAPGAASQVKGRVRAIDQYRGLAIMLMVVANYLSGVASVPEWLKHAPDVGLTPADLIAPLFIFAIGLTYGLSARRRLAREGKAVMVRHFLQRYLGLAGIGALLAGGQQLVLASGAANWGVLQAIGVAGLIALPTIGQPPGRKVLIGLGLLAAYQFVLDRYLLEAVLGSSHGGLAGAVAWGAMLVLGCALGDLYHGGIRHRRCFPWAILALGALGLALSAWVPVSKHRVSASYVLIAIGTSGLLFILFDVFFSRFEQRLLVAWGRNPLVLYLLHFPILGVFVLPPIPAWYALAKPWLVVCQLSAMLALLSAVAWHMARKGHIVSL